MASFSSRGPTGDWIKPDVTAPGVQVLAGMTPQPDQTTPTNGPSGNLYQAIAGTSMSSPHAAGVSALVKAAHPSWTPEEIKSALMTSSVQSRREGGRGHPRDTVRHGRRLHPRRPGGQPDPRLRRDVRGLRRGRVGRLHRIDLNIPSIDATTMSGQITTKRTALNVSGKHQALSVSVQPPAGAQITSPTSRPNTAASRARAPSASMPARRSRSGSRSAPRMRRSGSTSAASRSPRSPARRSRSRLRSSGGRAASRSARRVPRHRSRHRSRAIAVRPSPTWRASRPTSRSP